MGQAPTNALAADYTYRKKKEEQRAKYMTLHSHSERTHIRRSTPYIKQSKPRALSVDFAREESPASESAQELAPLQLRQFIGILSNEPIITNKTQDNELIDNASGEQYEEDEDGFHLSMDYDQVPQMQIDVESLKMLLLKRLEINEADNSHDADEDEEYDCLIHEDNEYTQPTNYHKATQSLELLMNANEMKSISEMMFGQHLSLDQHSENESVDEELINNDNTNDINKNEEHEVLSLKYASETTERTETDMFSSMHTSQSSHDKIDNKYKNIDTSPLSVDTPESMTTMRYSAARDSALNFIAHGGYVKNLKIRI